MPHAVFKKLELVGQSASGLEDAISTAVNGAIRQGHRVDWFEVTEIRGSVHDGKVTNYQVTVKLGGRTEA